MCLWAPSSALFITWNKHPDDWGHSQLRGCIGTLEPRRLHTAMHDYTLTRCAASSPGAWRGRTAPKLHVVNLHATQLLQAPPLHMPGQSQQSQHTPHSSVLASPARPDVAHARSALRDMRFSPITLPEIPRLSVGVSLLHGFEPAGSWDDWQVGEHGLIISFDDPDCGLRRTATFLPEVAAEQGWDRRACIEALIRKTGAECAHMDMRTCLHLRCISGRPCHLLYRCCVQIPPPSLPK